MSFGSADLLSRDDFIRIVMDGGEQGAALLRLVQAPPPAAGHRASENQHLAQLASDVMSILRSPINPFEGMLEAPSPIVRLYQAHKKATVELRPRRNKPLEELLRDTLGALYDGTSPLDWQSIENAGVSRIAPMPSPSVDPTENP